MRQAINIVEGSTEYHPKKKKKKETMESTSEIKIAQRG